MAGPRVNLNEVRPKSHAGFDFAQQSRGVTDGDITVFFGDVSAAAEEFIRESDAIVGCVAWVRGPRFVEVLAQRPVALVVNKEFSLRVEGHREREPLMRLNGGVPSKLLPAPIPPNAALDPIRCAGWAVRAKFGALMHHKFLVRLTKKGKSFVPTAVWTGSFNLTSGAGGNIENGMLITTPAVVEAFLAEFSRVYAISEPLNFTAGAPTPGGKGSAIRPAPARKKKAPTKRKATRAAPKKAAAKKATTKRTAAKAPVKKAAKAKAPVKRKAAPKRTTK